MRSDKKLSLVFTILAVALFAPSAIAGARGREQKSFQDLFSNAAELPVQQWSGQNLQLNITGRITQNDKVNGGPDYVPSDGTFSLKISGGNTQLVFWLKKKDATPPSYSDIGTTIVNSDKAEYFKSFPAGDKLAFYLITASLKLSEGNNILVLLRMYDPETKDPLAEYHGIAPLKNPAVNQAVDLSYQFEDYADRQQGNVGSCHVFTSISLLEAAYYRKYHRTIRFSEADLFLRKMLLDGSAYTLFLTTGASVLTEGGVPYYDSKFVIEHGVASAPSYDKFEKMYSWYRNAEQKTLQYINANVDNPDIYEPGEKAEQPLMPATTETVKAVSIRDIWVKLQTQPGMKKQIEQLFKISGEKLRAEREAIKNQLAGFSTGFWVNTQYSKQSATLSKEQCAKEGKTVSEVFLPLLKSQIPISVGVDLSYLKSWGQTPESRDARHGFTLIGYRQAPDGEYHFISRNSWGGWNPDIKESELCRTMYATLVFTPEEAKTANIPQ
ncbi:MAG: hypothetical protein WCS77_02110 [Elusimicrobiaceae bacterium]